MKSALEKSIQREIEADLGSARDVLLLRNSVGQAKHVEEETGKVFYVPYGLGKGSPDLVGALQMRGPAGRVFPSGDVVYPMFALWFGLEIKQVGQKPDPDQLKCHAIWRSFGIYVATVHSVTEARVALQGLRDRWKGIA